mmetsp:Transcript_35360/g.46831  ORF Transcript_35360/g.46831 Transcript_35360/m.46831 type:complete len:144 (-) Transcript_35360:176-607(-)
MTRLLTLLLIISSVILPSYSYEDTIEDTVESSMLRTKMCADFCSVDNCRTYVTPLNRCYNARHLFPGDDAWSDLDIMDVTMNGSTLPSEEFQREFYSTSDGSCGGETGMSTDSYTLPFGECVGPFGAPRPWGIMSVMDVAEEE